MAWNPKEREIKTIYTADIDYTGGLGNGRSKSNPMGRLDVKLVEAGRIAGFRRNRHHRGTAVLPQAIPPASNRSGGCLADTANSP